MFAKYLEGCFMTTAFHQIDLRKNLYLWTDLSGERVVDELTMLKIITKTINPTTRVGVGNLVLTEK